MKKRFGLYKFQSESLKERRNCRLENDVKLDAKE